METRLLNWMLELAAAQECTSGGTLYKKYMNLNSYYICLLPLLVD
jgi:hypothetical protein